jgi:hypothetical protein
MNGTVQQLVQPLSYRVWDPAHRTFFYSDVRPQPSKLVDRWTGLFDRSGNPIYEQDILRVHYNWKFGWVRAVVTRQEDTHRYVAEATGPDGSPLLIGFYSFVDAYRVGNTRQHPQKLVGATEQFLDRETSPCRISPTILQPSSDSCLN